MELLRNIDIAVLVLTALASRCRHRPGMPDGNDRAGVVAIDKIEACSVFSTSLASSFILRVQIMSASAKAHPRHGYRERADSKRGRGDTVCRSPVWRRGLQGRANARRKPGRRPTRKFFVF